MNKLAFITLSNEGARLLNRFMEKFPKSDFYISRKLDVKTAANAKRFTKITELTNEIFNVYGGLVYIAPCGAVVRAISRNVQNKKTDPAVVVVDVGGRYAVSLLSGHEGGANDLAVALANAIDAEPVISTSTEAAKNIIIGIGCRRGKEAGDIIDSIVTALSEAGVARGSVRLLASADIKSDEEGLIQAAQTLGIPIRFISSEEIRSSQREFARSGFVEKSVNLPAVAEPAALLAGRRTKLILQKRNFGGITIAIAKESSLSLE
ncbi:MAG: hypothetical protein IEMM0002_0682 [bacterium]|nr:MAG: hypothetical protein IEMM0002_0682 [bacterium]